MICTDRLRLCSLVVQRHVFVCTCSILSILIVYSQDGHLPLKSNLHKNHKSKGLYILPAVVGNVLIFLNDNKNV